MPTIVEQESAVAPRFTNPFRGSRAREGSATLNCQLPRGCVGLECLALTSEAKRAGNLWAEELVGRKEGDIYRLALDLRFVAFYLAWACSSASPLQETWGDHLALRLVEHQWPNPFSPSVAFECLSPPPFVVFSPAEEKGQKEKKSFLPNSRSRVLREILKFVTRFHIFANGI